MGGSAVTRRLVLVLSLVAALIGSVVATATADVQADVGLEIRLPLPALPIGPGPLYPLDAYGPRADDNAVLRWSEQTLAAIRVLKTGPTINARAVAIVHTAMYDAWAAYDPTAVGTRLGGSLRRPAAERTDAYKSQAVSYAAYRALLNLFPARSADFRALMTAMGYDPDDATTDPASPTGVGNQAAAAVLAFRANDRSNQANGYADTIGYVPVNTPDQVNDPFRWQPLRHPDGNGGTVVQTYLTPHWGNVTPFALTSRDQFLPPGPVYKTLQQQEGLVLRPRRQELVAGGERARGDVAPVRGQVRLDHRAAVAVGVAQRLPAERVVDLVGGVDRDVADGVGVAVGLVGPVVGPEGEHGRGGLVADPGRRRRVGGGVVGVVAHGRHQGPEVGRAGREQVEQGPVGGVADRLALVGVGALGGRAAQRPAEAGPDRGRVVGRPGVVHGRVHDGHGAGVDGRAGLEGPDGGQGLLAPAQRGVVVGPGPVAVQRVQRAGAERQGREREPDLDADLRLGVGGGVDDHGAGQGGDEREDEDE